MKLSQGFRRRLSGSIRKKKWKRISRLTKPGWLTLRHVQPACPTCRFICVTFSVTSAAAMVKSLLPMLVKIIHLALLFATALTAVAQSKPNYEIYAIRYATIPDFPDRKSTRLNSSHLG